MKDILISDFNNEYFKKAFKIYFDELDIPVKNWDNLFVHMNEDKDNFAYIRLSDENEVIGFIQFKCIELSNWFFKYPFGLIREFWISSEYRGFNHGKDLLNLAEEYFKNKNIFKSILTTDTAAGFYEKLGYIKEPYIYAENNDDVFIKTIK